MSAQETMTRIAELSAQALAILSDPAANPRDVFGPLVQIRTHAQLQAAKLRKDTLRAMPAASEVVQ